MKSCIVQVNINNNYNKYKYQQYLNTLHFNGIELPVMIFDISKFGKQNEGLSVNVFWIYGLYPSKKDVDMLIGLLFFNDKDTSQNNHYLYQRFCTNTI